MADDLSHRFVAALCEFQSVAKQAEDLIEWSRRLRRQTVELREDFETFGDWAEAEFRRMRERTPRK